MKKLLLLPLLFLVFGTVCAQVFPNGGWVTKTPLPVGRWGQGQTSFQTNTSPDTAKLYNISGADASFALVSDVSRFNTVTSVWSTLNPIPLYRYQQQAIYHNGKIYFIGGYLGGQAAQTNNDIYDVASNSWSAGAPLPTAVGDYAAGVNGDYIYIICGRSGTTDYNLVQVYNTNTNTWSSATAFPGIASSGCRAGIVRGQIIFAGGLVAASAQAQSQAWKGLIDPSNPNLITWTALPNYPGGTVWRFAAGTIEGAFATRVYFTGGAPDGTSAVGLTGTYAYNVATNQWETGPAKPTGANNISALSPLIVNDTLFFACTGGHIGNNIITNANEWLKIDLAHAPAAGITGPDSICTNTTATLTASATGISQQWQVSSDNINFTFIPGATTNSYTTPALSQTTYYRYVTYAVLDSAISASHMVYVADPVVITSQPSSVTLCGGSSTSFTVAATGSDLTYQWYQNNVALPNAGVYSGVTTPTLSISDVTGLNGYSYTVVVRNSCNTMTSNPATITQSANNVWNGSVSTAWSDAANWGCGIPDITTDAEIPASAPNMPLVDIPDAICYSITIDAGASLAFTGTDNALEIKTYISHAGTFDPSLGKIILSGSVTQDIPGVTYKHLDIRNFSTKILEDDATVTDILSLEQGNIMINKKNLTLASPGSISGGSASSYIVTNDSGVVIAQSLGTGGNTGSVLIPVGRDGRGYTPVTLQNSGALDTFNVRVKYDVYNDGYGNGFNPPKVISPVVNRTWLITENTPGGSNVNMTLQWVDSNQINNFSTSHVYIAHYTGGQWVGLSGPSASAPAAGGSNPYFTSASGIQSFSPFTVASSGIFPLVTKTINAAEFNLDAYPNPAMSVITLNVNGTVSGTATVVMTDIAGRVVKAPVEMTGNKVEINIADVAVGMYFIKYTDDTHQELIKVNKQ